MGMRYFTLVYLLLNRVIELKKRKEQRKNRGERVTMEENVDET
jgi:hypothetical protein